MASTLRHGVGYLDMEYTSIYIEEEDKVRTFKKKDTFVGYRVFHMEIDSEE
jgi:hypothetical protein